MTELGTLILEPERYSPKAISLYEKNGPVWREGTDRVPREQVRWLVVRLAHRIDASMLADYPNLTALVSPTTGHTHIDLRACSARGVRVYSLQDCPHVLDNVTSTAELTMALMLALWRRVPWAHSSVVDKEEWNRDDFRGRQLLGARLGLVGLGRLGKMVAARARSFGIEVAAYDPYLSSEHFQRAKVERRASLADLARDSDMLSIHANLRDDNLCLVSEAVISALPRGAIIINTARGALLDEDAAVVALERSQLNGVGADVLATEHEAGGWSASPLVAASRRGATVLLTPHIGGASDDAMHHTEIAMAELVLREAGQS